MPDCAGHVPNQGAIASGQKQVTVCSKEVGLRKVTIAGGSCGRDRSVHVAEIPEWPLLTDD